MTRWSRCCSSGWRLNYPRDRRNNPMAFAHQSFGQVHDSQYSDCWSELQLDVSKYGIVAAQGGAEKCCVCLLWHQQHYAGRTNPGIHLCRSDSVYRRSANICIRERHNRFNDYHGYNAGARQSIRLRGRASSVQQHDSRECGRSRHCGEFRSDSLGMQRMRRQSHVL